MKTKTCERTGKIGYTDEIAAKLALAKIRKKSHCKKVYRCPYCDDWHLTSHPK